MSKDTTDTNQASEDELENTLRAVYGAGYLANQIDLELEDGEPMLEAAIGVACKSVESLIRTEKLKLLAEVRERVIGEDTTYEGHTMNWAVEHHNHLRAEQRDLLTQLEAEL